MPAQTAKSIDHRNSHDNKTISRLRKESEKMGILRKTGISIAIILITFMFSTQASAEKKIGILLFSNEVRYAEAKKGFIDSLNEKGFGGKDIKIYLENAGGNKARAAELVQKFTAAKMNLIFTVGTHATTAVMHDIKDVPIVFSVVYDPVVVGIAKS